MSSQHAIERLRADHGPPWASCQGSPTPRVQFSNIIRRYMAGDETLKDEIDANAQSSSPVAQMTRALVKGDGEEEHDRKRRRLTDDAQYRGLALGNINTAMDIMSKLNPAWRNDGRLLLQLENQVKNIVVPP